MSAATVIFKDTNAEGGLDVWVEGVPRISPLNAAAKKIYDIAQGFAAMPDLLSDPDGAMNECRIIISDDNGKIMFTFDFGKGVSDEAPASISQQLVVLIMTEMADLLGGQS